MSHALSPIGLDIGSAAVKVAQLVMRRSGRRITAAAAFDRTAHGEVLGETEIDRLLEVLDRAGFQGPDVVVGAPRSRLHTAVLELPPRKSGAPIEQICQAEVTRMFRLTGSSFEMHTWEMPSLSTRLTTTQMAATALAWDDAGALIEPLDRAGLMVQAVDLSSEATARACAPVMRGLEELSVLIDLGASGLDVLVFRQGERVYQRRLEGLGSGAMVRELARKLVISPRGAGAIVRHFGLCDGEEAQAESAGVALARARVIMREQTDLMLQDVLSSVAYALDRFPGEAVTAVRLAGGGASLRGLAPYLAEVSGLDVRLVEPQIPSRGQQTRPAALHRACLTAIGHAMWGSEA